MIRDAETGWVEPTVMINGRQLTFAEAMTLRVAVSTMRLQMHDPKSRQMLGPLADNYDAHLQAIEHQMQKVYPVVESAREPKRSK